MHDFESYLIRSLYCQHRVSVNRIYICLSKNQATSTSALVAKSLPHGWGSKREKDGASLFHYTVATLTLRSPRHVATRMVFPLLMYCTCLHRNGGLPRNGRRYQGRAQDLEHGYSKFSKTFFDSLKYRLISHNPLLPFPKKRPHQELVVALPFFSKNLTQIRYQFITNIFCSLHC